MNIALIVSRNFTIISEEALLSEVIGKLKTGQSSLLVFSGKNFAGIPDQRKFLKVGLDVSQAKVKHFLHTVPMAKESEDLTVVAGLLNQSQADFLPVERKGQIIGVITAISIIETALSLPEALSWKVNDIELVTPTAIEKNDTVAQAIGVMVDEKMDHLPIMDGTKLYGILSYHDFMQKYLLSTPQREHSTKFGKISSSSRGGGTSPKMTSLPVSAISTNQNLLTVTGETLLFKAVQDMKHSKVSDLIVMQNKEFKGLLMAHQILQRIVGLRSSSKAAEAAIQFIGLHDTHLSSEMQERIKEIARQESEKVLRHSSEECKMVIHLKEHAKASKKHNYSIHLRLEFPGKIINAQDDDWKVLDALYRVFERAESEVQKTFRNQEKEWKKKRGKIPPRFPRRRKK